MVQTQISERGSVYHLADNPKKNIVIYINDWHEEYGAAFVKLANKLGRPLRGILLIDKSLKESGKNRPDPTGMFEEVIVDFSDAAALRAALKPLDENLLLVSCSSERSQSDFQKVLPHLPYVLGPSERSLEWATHKGKMRELIGAYDKKLVPKVQAVKDASDEEIAKVLRKLTFPMIIKPTGLFDSALVAKVNDENELKATLQKSFAALHDTYDRKHGNGKPGIIVEEFIVGEIFSIDGYVNAAGKVWLLPLLRSVSAYQMGGEGFSIYHSETYHELTEKEEYAGRKAAEDAIHAIGLRSSVAHVELYKTDDGWKIIEIGARPGAMRQEAYEVSYGVDHALNELLIKIGKLPEMGNGRIIHSMIFKVYPNAAGEVESVAGVETARQHPSAYKVVQIAKPGTVILPIMQGGSVAVLGLFIDDDVARLRENVAQVRSAIKINVKEAPEAAKKNRTLAGAKQS